jgi:hypothetical protein
MKRGMWLVVVLAVLISLPAFAKTKDYVTAKDIQKVNLNDTFDDVTGKIGEPQQVLSKELTAEGKEQVVWQYDFKVPASSNILKSALDGAAWGASPDMMRNKERREIEKQSNSRIDNPPYLIIFTNGKVSKIDRQKVEAVPTAQVNVQSY